MKKSIILMVYLSFSGAWAMESNKVSTKSPSPKTWGTFVAIGNPYPTILGLNAAYNLNEDFRLSLGYGDVEVTSSVSFSESGFTTKKVNAQSYSFGGDYLMTDWAVRPMVGLKIGYFSVSGDGEIELNGISKSTFLTTSNLGFDYLSRGGFYAGLGTNVALVGASGTGFYANLGYFF